MGSGVIHLIGPCKWFLHTNDPRKHRKLVVGLFVSQQTTEWRKEITGSFVSQGNRPTDSGTLCPSDCILLVQIQTVNKVSLRLFSDNNLVVKDHFAYEPNQYWVTEMENELVAGQTVVLHLEFSGSLVEGIVGYYKSTYTNAITGDER